MSCEIANFSYTKRWQAFEKMTRIIILLMIYGVLVFSSCQRQTKKHDFGEFIIKLPSSWEVNDIQGIDSYVKQIITASGDTLHFDLGYYSNKLEEPKPMLIPKSEKKLLISQGIDIDDFIFLDSIDQKSYLDYLIQKRQDTIIDGFKAFLVSPNQSGKGITGIYFDSIANGGMGNIRLNFYGRDLSKREQDQLLSAISTLKIKK